MACTEHNWLFDGPCPKCVLPQTVTDAIPDFLLRNPDGSFKHPEPLVGQAHVEHITAATPSSMPREPTVEERQAVYREAHAEQKRQKSRERIAKMKAKLTAKEPQ